MNQGQELTWQIINLVPVIKNKGLKILGLINNPLDG
jgi:hypothetical protein